MNNAFLTFVLSSQVFNKEVSKGIKRRCDKQEPQYSFNIADSLRKGTLVSAFQNSQAEQWHYTVHQDDKKKSHNNFL